jgi:hypothetical protein
MTPEFYETVKFVSILCCIGFAMMLTASVALYVIWTRTVYES